MLIRIIKFFCYFKYKEKLFQSDSMMMMKKKEFKPFGHFSNFFHHKTMQILFCLAAYVGLHRIIDLISSLRETFYGNFVIPEQIIAIKKGKTAL